MKYASFFNEILGCTDSKQVFKYLVNNLNDSIRSWDYFVNWDRVLGNIKDLEIDLSTLT
jgi:type II restriction enzyme